MAGRVGVEPTKLGFGVQAPPGGLPKSGDATGTRTQGHLINSQELNQPSSRIIKWRPAGGYPPDYPLIIMAGQKWREVWDSNP